MELKSLYSSEVQAHINLNMVILLYDHINKNVRIFYGRTIKSWQVQTCLALFGERIEAMKKFFLFVIVILGIGYLYFYFTSVPQEISKPETEPLTPQQMVKPPPPVSQINSAKPQAPQRISQLPKILQMAQRHHLQVWQQSEPQIGTVNLTLAAAEQIDMHNFLDTLTHSMSLRDFDAGKMRVERTPQGRNVFVVDYVIKY